MFDFHKKTCVCNNNKCSTLKGKFAANKPKLYA